MDKAREIVKLVKETKVKVQAAIQEDQFRVSGKSCDDLQAVIAPASSWRRLCGWPGPRTSPRG